MRMCTTYKVSIICLYVGVNSLHVCIPSRKTACRTVLCVCICVAALITHVLDIHVHSELELASSLVPLTKKVEGLV